MFQLLSSVLVLEFLFALFLRKAGFGYSHTQAARTSRVSAAEGAARLHCDVTASRAAKIPPPQEGRQLADTPDRLFFFLPRLGVKQLTAQLAAVRAESITSGGGLLHSSTYR
jgi:hypothetical protein